MADLLQVNITSCPSVHELRGMLFRLENQQNKARFVCTDSSIYVELKMLDNSESFPHMKFGGTAIDCTIKGPSRPEHDEIVRLVTGQRQIHGFVDTETGEGWLKAGALL